MSFTTTTSTSATSTPLSGDQSSRPDALLRCGFIAGPLFIGTYLAQALLRSNYNPAKHPMSLLANGAGGVVQILNFVVAGVLVLTFAHTAKRSLANVRGSVGTRRGFAAFGIGLIIAGVFVADPGAGFPIGAPEGRPDMTSIGLLHEVGFGVAQIGFIAGALAARRYFKAIGQARNARRSLLGLIVVLVVAGFPHAASFAPRIVAASATEFLFLACFTSHVLRNHQATTPPTGTMA